MSNDFKYGEHIREARQRLGLSQDAFANALNISARTVARWEANDSTPNSASHRIDLAHGFLAAHMDDVAWELNPALETVFSIERLGAFFPSPHERHPAVDAVVARVFDHSPSARASHALGAARFAVMSEGRGLNERGLNAVALGAMASNPLLTALLKGVNTFSRTTRDIETSLASAPPAERQARVLQILANVADRHDMNLSHLTLLLDDFLKEMQERGLTLDDVKAAFKRA